MTVDEHLKEIDAWVEETVQDRAGSPFAVTADECYSDIVHSYIAAEVGEGTKAAKEILRRTGC